MKRSYVTRPRTDKNAATPVCRGVLIVEPDPLLRWSVATYLGKWFEVFPVDSVASAVEVLGRRPVHTVLISDVLPRRAAETIESKVHSGDPSATIIHMVTSVPQGTRNAGVRCIEKPFQLAALARLLGVADP